MSIKLEVDREYIMRDGRAVYVSVFNAISLLYPYEGYVVHDSEINLTWDENGKYNTNNEHIYDIVALVGGQRPSSTGGDSLEVFRKAMCDLPANTKDVAADFERYASRYDI